MILIFAVTYLCGSIPFGLILTKIFAKTDIRTIGSGNIGATNVLRTGNKKLALATLILDVAKGIVPLSLLDQLSYIDDTTGMQLVMIGAFGVVIGHCFPVWLKFNGGKGVATAFGVLIAAVPLSALVSAATWGIVAGFFRYSSAAALSAAAIAPLTTLLIYGPMPAVIIFLIAVIVIARHKDNIKRLVAGEETKIGQKSKAAKEPQEEGRDDASSQHSE